jgi:hypothetical protein
LKKWTTITRYRSALGSGYESVSRDISVPNQIQKNEETQLTYHSGIRDWTVKTDFDFTPNVNHDIKFGTAYTYHTFMPDVTSLKVTDSSQTEQNIDTGCICTPFPKPFHVWDIGAIYSYFRGFGIAFCR